MLADTIEPMLCAAEAMDGPESYLEQGSTDVPLHVAALPIVGSSAAEGCGLEITADFIDSIISEVIADLGYEQRFQGLRHVISILVQLVRGNAAKLRVALALLCRRLPQPYIRGEDLPVDAGVPLRLRRMLDAFLHQLEDPAPGWEQRDFVNFDDVVPHCGPLSPLSISIMQFLENGDYDVHDDLDSPDAVGSLVPVPHSEPIEDVMTSTVPPTHTAADEDRPPVEVAATRTRNREDTTVPMDMATANTMVPNIEIHDSPLPPSSTGTGVGDLETMASSAPSSSTRLPNATSTSTTSSPDKNVANLDLTHVNDL